jgi:hypothetical protein
MQEVQQANPTQQVFATLWQANAGQDNGHATSGFGWSSESEMHWTSAL